MWLRACTFNIELYKKRSHWMNKVNAPSNGWSHACLRFISEQTKRWSKFKKMTIHSIKLSVQVMLWINTDKIWKWCNDNNYNS